MVGEAQKPKRGRPPGRKPKVQHRTRPAHDAQHPMHITMRAAPRLRDLRAEVVYRALETAFRRTRRPDFRIVEYSVQSTHLHLIAEASDNDALSRGMKSFSVRANRLFNAATGRKRGRVWGDRYWRRDLTTPRQVRNALVYCLFNYKKHKRISLFRATIDACSSARWFDGWSRPREREDREPRAPPTERARTKLLSTSWRHLGLIHPSEYPRS